MNALAPVSSPGISERKILQGGLVVGVCILAGQLLGFIRQATIAYLLGTGPPADAIAVAFAPVDLWWSVLATTVIFGFGPLLAAPERSPAFARLARPVATSAVGATMVCLLAAEAVAGVFAPGLVPETAAHATSLLRIVSLAIPAVSCSTLFTALLYSERKFAFAAFHQGAVNAVTIASAIALHSRFGAAGFAIGYTAGAWAQLGAAWWIARPILRRRRSDAGRLDGGVFLRPAAVLCYALFVGLNPVATRALASTFGTGSTAAFDYCLKLMGVPLALLVNSLSSSLLSEIAPFRWRGDRQVAIRTIGRATLSVALASSAIVVFILALAGRIVATLFERGRFDAASTATVTGILTGFYPVLAAWCTLDVIARSMFALGKWRAPVLCAGVALLVNLVLSCSGVITSVRWIGTPAVAGFGLGAVVATFYLRTIGGSRLERAERPE
jgi:putative peptidoglycan lipid II flippase